MNDNELQGMWSESDISGGEADNEWLNKAEKIERALDLLIAEWIEVGKFLDNEHDTLYDRAVGKTYKRCAFELKKALGA